MKKVLFIFSLALVCVSLFGQTKNFIDRPYLETSVRYDTLVTPDRITLSIDLDESDVRGKQTVKALEGKMYVTLEEIGIDLNEQLSIADLSSNFKKYFLKRDSYFERRSFELLVYDARTAAEVIRELEKIGVSDVTLFKTEYSKIEALKIELKSKAMSKAVKQAEAILLPLNQPLGKAIHITDEYAGVESQRADRLLRGSVAGIVIRGDSFLKDPAERFMVDFEKIKVTSRLLVKFEIAQ